MSNIAIRVDHLSKLYHLGRGQSRTGDSLRSQRHDTTSARLSAGLRDALVGALPRIPRKGDANSWQMGCIK
jgi:hypothetical protein